MPRKCTKATPANIPRSKSYWTRRERKRNRAFRFRPQVRWSRYKVGIDPARPGMDQTGYFRIPRNTEESIAVFKLMHTPDKAQ